MPNIKSLFLTGNSVAIVIGFMTVLLWVAGWIDALSLVLGLVLLATAAVNLFWLYPQVMLQQADTGNYQELLRQLTSLRNKPAELAALRETSRKVLRDIVGFKGVFTAGYVTDAVAALKVAGTFNKALTTAEATPLALGILQLAGHCVEGPNEDRRVRLSGLITFLNSPGLDERPAERTPVERAPAERSPVNEAPQGPRELPVVAKPVLPDPIDAALRVFTMEEIYALPAARRQSLFAKLKSAAEAAGRELTESELRDIQRQFS